MRTLAVILSFLVASQSFAQVKYVEQGTPAPYTGYLISPETEKKFRLMDVDLEYYKKVSLTQESIIKGYEANEIILTARIDNQNKAINHLTDQLAKDNSVWGKIGFFLLGALCTTAIVWGVNRVQ